ncbi:hypothetical protein [Novosphingobium mathurense]|uniref:hypothetical protein n=1 Tax=Novosphingobium mathurense TaxID=428990 RepID=UPI00159030F7|nr:hypothetical protein [Novosphingobium mathurense]
MLLQAIGIAWGSPTLTRTAYEWLHAAIIIAAGGAGLAAFCLSYLLGWKSGED